MSLVSFMGMVGTGKSFIINHLLPPTAPGPWIAPPEEHVTYPGMLIFHGESNAGEARCYMELEGMLSNYKIVSDADSNNLTTCPIVDINRAFFNSDVYPQIAYLTSTVMCFVINEQMQLVPSNLAYFLNIAQRAILKTEVDIKPALFFVYTKQYTQRPVCGPEILNSPVMTAALKYYSKVEFFAVSDATAHPDIHLKQVAELRNRINAQCRELMDARRVISPDLISSGCIARRLADLIDNSERTEETTDLFLAVTNGNHVQYKE